MEKFMLIVREDLKRIGQQTDEERLSTFPEMGAWVQALADAGNWIEGQPLHVTGRYVSQSTVLSDGPFIEAKEGISGFDIILADDIEHAVRIAQSCPMVKRGMAVREVRQVMKMD